MWFDCIFAKMNYLVWVRKKKKYMVRFELNAGFQMDSLINNPSTFSHTLFYSVKEVTTASSSEASNS